MRPGPTSSPAGSRSPTRQSSLSRSDQPVGDVGRLEPKPGLIDPAPDDAVLGLRQVQAQGLGFLAKALQRLAIAAGQAELEDVAAIGHALESDRAIGTDALERGFARRRRAPPAIEMIVEEVAGDQGRLPELHQAAAVAHAL